jgi:hypothetical protein
MSMRAALALGAVAALLRGGALFAGGAAAGNQIFTSANP